MPALAGGVRQRTKATTGRMNAHDVPREHFVDKRTLAAEVLLCRISVRAVGAPMLTGGATARRIHAFAPYVNRDAHGAFAESWVLPFEVP
jgi:hypothetical protein